MRRIWRPSNSFSRGSRLATIVPVQAALWQPPLLHIGSYAVTRRDAFSNGLFAQPGSQPLALRYRPHDLRRDARGQDAENPAARLDLCEYDFVLLVESGPVPPERPAGIRRIASGASFELFRVEPVAAGCPQWLNRSPAPKARQENGKGQPDE